MKLFAFIAGLALVASACVSDDSPGGVALELDEQATIVVANSPGTLTTNGPQRLLVALIGDGPNEFLGGSDQPATIELRPVEGEGETTVTGEWVSSPGVSLGLYVTKFTFAEPGIWEVSIPGADPALTPAQVQILEESSVPGPGEPAPATVTPTGSTLDELTAISTDPAPELSFYDLTIAEAVANGQPSVIVFATPAFCRTAVCGPTIELAKQAAAGRDDVDFVHVEPFDIEAARAGTLVPTEAVLEWQLATEPWVFVLDAEGVIAASFEGIIGADELTAAIDEVS